MRIDLHTHSWVSDGTEAPAALVAAAAAQGVQIVATTDHDQTAGWDESRDAAAEHGIGWVGGMEVTCRVPASGKSVHMLCYLHDPTSPDLLAGLTRLRVDRETRAQRIVERLAQDFAITWDHVLGMTQEGSTVGRPHIADALVDLGIVPTRSDAFTDLLSPRNKYYVGTPALDPVDAVRLIHSAGGVAVMAHPAASKRGRVVDREEMLAVVEAGLDGVEVHHRDNSEQGRADLLTLASERDLIVTGSSDYHGRGKPNRLGEHTTAPDQLARIIRKAESLSSRTGTARELPYAGFGLEDLTAS
ncbi:MAG: PHP domain-containing protein [Galactobacter sp.]